MAEKVVDLSKAEWGKTRTSGAADWQHRQRRRMRYHSRIVISLKVLFPSLAAVMIGLVIAWPQMKAQQEEAVSLLASETEQKGTPDDQAMINPRFFTVDEKGEPFNLTADTAFELPGENRRIRLNEVKADVLLEHDRWIAVDAQTGIYSQSDDTMELSEQVNLYTQTGDEMETTQALINLKNRDIFGNRDVFLRSETGYARAQGFSVTENGTVIRLKGKTRVVVYPENEEE